MNPKLLAVLAALALTLSACGGAVSQAPSAPVTQDQSAMESESKAGQSNNGGVTGGAPANAPAGGTANSPQSNAQTFDRLVIKTADASITVEDVRATEAALRTRIATFGGYVIQSQANGIDQDLTVQIAFRVPVDKFDDALGGVQSLAKKLNSLNVHGDDVTEEFVDLQSRQRTLEATRDRLLDLLNRAQTVEDTLRINQNLTDIQSQIDQAEGRIKFLSQSAAMSTINVSILPVPVIAEQPLVEEGWQPLVIARQSLHQLLLFGQGLASVLIVLLIWSPVWGGILLVVWFVRRKMQGPRQDQSAPNP